MGADIVTDAELNALITELRNHTALGRIALVEVRAIFAKIADLGYAVSKVAD